HLRPWRRAGWGSHDRGTRPAGTSRGHGAHSQGHHQPLGLGRAAGGCPRRRPDHVEAACRLASAMAFPNSGTPGRRTGPGTGPDRGQLFLVAGCEGQAGTARWNRGADRGFWRLLGPASTVAVTAGTMESQGLPGHAEPGLSLWLSVAMEA